MTSDAPISAQAARCMLWDPAGEDERIGERKRAVSSSEKHAAQASRLMLDSVSAVGGE